MYNFLSDIVAGGGLITNKDSEYLFFIKVSKGTFT